MYRPNRIGPWPCVDIEVVPNVLSSTAALLSDDAVWPIIKGIVPTVTVRDSFTASQMFWVTKTLNAAGGTALNVMAYGVLISGVNATPDANVIYSVCGHAFFMVQETDEPMRVLFPIISRLDATPTDINAAIVITDYAMLPMTTHIQTGQLIQASVNTQCIVGDISGATSSQSALPIFVGWAFGTHENGAYVVTMGQNINVHKYLSDIPTQDPSR